MPWIAEHKGEKVTPQDVSARDLLTCPNCDQEMYVRGPFTRSDGTFVARHFSHSPSDSSGGDSESHIQCGGESDKHERMKAITLSKIKFLFEGAIDEIQCEMPIADSEKRTDIGVIFRGAIDSHEAIATADCISGAVGDRLAIETQYRNKSKDIRETTRVFAEHGYSTLWLYPEQFTDYDVALFEGDGAVWTPIYPEVLCLDIDSPAGPAYHSHLIELTQTNAVVKASFPPQWYESELKRHLALNGSKPQYECWSQLFPDVAKEFRELAEKMLTEPETKAKLLLDSLYPTLDPAVMWKALDEGKMPRTEAVCGNCFYSKEDDFRADESAIICWKNQPDGAGNKPRKLTLNDAFAQDCPSFSFNRYKNEEMAQLMDLHEAVERPLLLKELYGARGATKRDRRKAALKFAYYQTWGSQEWNDLNFSPAREEGFLRHLDSEQAVPHEDGCATRGSTIFPPEETDNDDMASLADYI